MSGPCEIPPPGWSCTRDAPHDGPCAAVPTNGVREVQLGVIEFHCNEALRKDFYMVTDDCKTAGQIVDVWLMDLQTILARNGYKMTITTELPKPVPAWMKKEIEVCLGCGKPTATSDCGCPAGTGMVRR